MSEQNNIKITLIRSRYGRLPSHKATLVGLGLRRINQSVILKNTNEVQGMIRKVAYLLKVEEQAL